MEGGELRATDCSFLSNHGTQGTTSNDSQGGAIRATNCRAITLTDSTFTGNSAAAGYGGDAGAVFLRAARISIVDCNFTANRAIDTSGNDSSGASTAWLSVANSPAAFALIERCNFSGGQGRLSTLRLSNFPGNVAPMIVRDSTFSNSQAVWGGSVMSEGFTVIDGCYFAESGNGTEGHSLEVVSPTEILNCEFETCCPARFPEYVASVSGSVGYQCPGNEADVDCNGIVNSSDLGLLLALWGSTDQRGDLDGNGNVDAGDLGALLAQW